MLDLLEKADGVVVYALDRVARSLWDLAAVVKELEARNRLLVSVREERLQSIDPKIWPTNCCRVGLGGGDGARIHTRTHKRDPRAAEGPGEAHRQTAQVVGDDAPPHNRLGEEGPYA